MSFEAPYCSGAEPVPVPTMRPSDGAQPGDATFQGASETVTFKGCGGAGGLKKAVIKAFLSHQKAYSQRRRAVVSALLLENKVCTG